MKILSYICFAFLLVHNTLIAATTRTVTSNANSGSHTLREALSNSASGDTIHFNLPAGSTTIKITSALPFIEHNLTISGANAGGKIIIDGNNSHPGFFVKDGTVSISDLKIEKCTSQGGRGGIANTGGGGGMGAGGGVFINNTATVTLTNIGFNEGSALGGSGGTGQPGGRILCGGGGGLGGNGGSATTKLHLTTQGGGGGGLYANASERIGGGSEGGDGQRFIGIGPDDGLDFGGGGGTHGNETLKHAAGVGGFAGGGGGASSVKGGDGGTGGGGGGSKTLSDEGGSGGKFYDTFGGGHGGVVTSGENKVSAGGGGGTGVGGALFIREGGTLYFNSDIKKNQSVKPGTAGTSFTTQTGETNGSADGAGIFIMQSGSLILNPGLNKTKVIEAQISGQGSITKNGAGTYILRATNNYTGLTTIDNGTLIVNGSIKTSTTTVGSSATLRGTGALGPLTVNGTVKPGNSIGTLQVNGNYTQNANSTYLVEIEPTGGSSKLDISGSAIINNPSTIEVTALSGEYDIDHRYTVLTAQSGRTGEYLPFTVTNPNELDSGSLTISYTPNTIDLTFLTNSDNIITAARSIGFVGHNLLNQVNHLQSDLGFEESILRYYQSLCKCPSKKIRPYFSANYLHGHYKTSTYTLASPFSLSGMVMGLDYWNQTDLIIGSFFNYLRGWTNTTNNKLRSTCNNYTLSLYVQKIFENFFIESFISATNSDLRKARLSNTRKINESKPNGYGLSFQARVAKIIKYKKIICLPTLALRYFYNYMDSYKEKFDRLSRFEISSSKNNILEALVSTNFSYRYLINSAEFIPQFEVTYIRDLLKEKISFTSTRGLLSEKRDHTIKTNPKNCVKLKSGLDYRFKNCSILNLSYIASFSTNQRITNEVHLGYRIDF